jgi:hypothetical protein
MTKVLLVPFVGEYVVSRVRDLGGGGGGALRMTPAMEAPEGTDISSGIFRHVGHFF